MAVLNTARAVLKDDATRRQVHVIRRHLGELSRDFDRFQSRMDNLARHIDQANRDVEAVHVSARKISDRFGRIEAVDVDEPAADVLEATPPGGNGQP
jgi:DNA recombination protein RmuC